jgi:hypothetical protein
MEPSPHVWEPSVHSDPSPHMKSTLHMLNPSYHIWEPRAYSDASPVMNQVLICDISAYSEPSPHLFSSNIHLWEASCHNCEINLPACEIANNNTNNVWCSVHARFKTADLEKGR